MTHEDVIDLMALMESKGIAPKDGPQPAWHAQCPIQLLEGSASPLGDVEPMRRNRAASHPSPKRLPIPRTRPARRARGNAQAGPYKALDRVLYRTAAMTGLRLGELIALRWRDVDWTASAIRVRSNYHGGPVNSRHAALA